MGAMRRGQDEAWRVEVLGPTRLVGSRSGRTVPLTAKQAVLLARLAVSAPEPVSTDALIDALWGEAAPATARESLHNHVSRIRSAAEAHVIVTAADGYALGPEVGTDVAIVTAALARSQRELSDGRAESGLAELDEAFGLLRGAPAPELADATALAGTRVWLEGLAAAVVMLRLECAVESGRSALAVPEAERLVSEDAHDETRWALLARALAGAGRRGDALGAIARARTALREDLGLPIGVTLAGLERRLLAEDEIPRPRARPRRSTALHGREVELELLTAAAADRRDVVLVGEDGIGRSALLEALVGWLRRSGQRVAVAVCEATPSTGVALLTTLVEELGETVDPRLGPIDGFLATLARTSERRSVVLVVDDLHHAGPSTRAALERARALEGVTLVASRVADVGVTLVGAEEVVLGALSEDAMAALADDLVRGTLDPEARARLVGLAGGNPFVLQCLVEDPDHGDDVTAGMAALAPLVRRRLARLGPPARAAVEVAAVAGIRCRRPVLHVLASEVGVRDALAAGLLVADGDEVTFRHAAIAGVVLEGLVPGRRAEYHHAIAGLEAEAGRPAAVVAHHLLAAVELDAGAALAAAMRAGAEASAIGAHRDAARWYARATEAARAMGPRSEAELVRADIAHGDELRLAGDPSHRALLVDACERALALDDPGLVAEAAYALLQLGATSEAGSADVDAIALGDRALARLEGDARWAVVAGAASLACSLTGLADRSRELYFAAESRAVEPDVRRRVLPFTYLGAGHVDDLERRQALTEELLGLAAASDDAVAAFEGHHLAFSVALQRADGPGVRASLAAMEGLVDRVGDVGRRWQLLYCAAALAHLEDDLERAEGLSEAAFAVLAEVAPARAFAVHGSQLILLRLAAGRVAELAPAFEGLVATQPDVGAWHGLLALCIAESEPQRASEHARIGIDAVPRDFTWLASHVLGARAAARAARAGATDAPLEPYRVLLEPYAERVAWQGTCAYGPVATALAELALARGDDAGARRALGTAERLAAALRAPVFAREVAELSLGGRR